MIARDPNEAPLCRHRAQSSLHRIGQAFAPRGVVETVAGAHENAPRGSAGPATEVRIGQVRAVAWAPGVGAFYACTQPGLVWRVADGLAAPVAGTGVDGNTGHEGDALELRLGAPQGMSLAPGGFLIADTDNKRVCHVRSHCQKCLAV